MTGRTGRRRKMRLTGNTVLITGGGTGIGRALGEALHAMGNVVIIGGRRRAPLEDTLAANPGMHMVELDVSNPVSIAAAAKDVVARFPGLNMLVNNAGVMYPDNSGGPIDYDVADMLLATNFLGPVKLSSMLVEQLKRQPVAAIVNVSSVLGFVPFARAAVYSASKAALHAYTMAQRHQLRETTVRVVEIVPPRVQLDPNAPAGDIPAMPVAEFVRQAIDLLGSGADEVVVDAARPMRANPGAREHAFFTRMNLMAATAALD